ncbi:unnamed protein product [Rotaria sordida]|uniref:Uncharacterized protein n=1 Tax=Rotaria sordida TaxID=392033 RepID=A0A814GUE8_9BILA|nr:unnamed protein product [Rotaria sordida]CAF1074509.1 unnamed protein product [Rotaria sordida]
MRSTFVLLLTLGCISLATAYQCYVCSSANNAACGESLKATDLNSILKVEVPPGSVCGVANTTMLGTAMVIRYVGPIAEICIGGTTKGCQTMQFIISALNNLANIYAEYAGQYDKAAKYHGQTFELDRNTIATLINFGLTLASVEEYSAASHYFVSTLNILKNPDDIDYLHYGLLSIEQSVGSMKKCGAEDLQELEYYKKAQTIYLYSIP